MTGTNPLTVPLMNHFVMTAIVLTNQGLKLFGVHVMVRNDTMVSLQLDMANYSLGFELSGSYTAPKMKLGTSRYVHV